MTEIVKILSAVCIVGEENMQVAFRPRPPGGGLCSLVLVLSLSRHAPLIPVQFRCIAWCRLSAWALVTPLNVVGYEQTALLTGYKLCPGKFLFAFVPLVLKQCRITKAAKLKPSDLGL